MHEKDARFDESLSYGKCDNGEEKSKKSLSFRDKMSQEVIFVKNK